MTSLQQPIKYDGFESVSVSVQRQSAQKAVHLVGQSNSMQRLAMQGVMTLEHCLQQYVQSEAVEIESKQVHYRCLVSP